MSENEAIYVVFAGEDYYPNRGSGDILDVVRRKYLDKYMFAELSDLERTADWFYFGSTKQGGNKPPFLRAEYKHIDWWEVIEISARAWELTRASWMCVARGHADGEADPDEFGKRRLWVREIAMDGLERE